MHRLNFTFLCICCLLLCLAPGQGVLAKETNSLPAGTDPLNAKPEGSLLQEEMRAYLGIPYRLGGVCTTGMDCSGFSKHVYSKIFGVELPHKAAQQFKLPFLENIAKDELKTGDLIFFARKKSIDHVGIYLADGKFLHASRKKGKITISSLDTPYFTRNFVGARRLADLDNPLDNDRVQTEGNLEYALDERSRIRFHFAGLAQTDYNDSEWGWNDRGFHSFLDLLGDGYDQPFSLEVEYRRALLDHAWNVTLSALWENAFLDGPTGSPYARFNPLRPTFLNTDSYLVSRSGLRIESEIDLFTWLRITPSLTYFDYAEEENSEAFPSVFGLEARMFSPAAKYDLSMALHYGDSQTHFLSIVEAQEPARSLGMAFALRYHMTDLMRLSVMGRHCLYQGFQGSAKDGQNRYEPYHDLLFTLDFSY